MPAAKNTVTVKFEAERETKRTFRFAEVGDPDKHKIGTLYVKKDVLDALGNPQDNGGLTVTLKG